SGAEDARIVRAEGPLPPLRAKARPSVATWIRGGRPHAVRRRGTDPFREVRAVILKAALFLLVAVSVLAIFGRARLPRLGRATRCDRCGRPLIGKDPCPCRKDRA